MRNGTNPIDTGTYKGYRDYLQNRVFAVDNPTGDTCEICGNHIPKTKKKLMAEDTYTVYCSKACSKDY